MIDFPELEKEYRSFLSDSHPLVIRLDGKNVTKKHKKYPLTNEHGFTWHLYQTGKSLAANKNCLIYAGLDEISFLYPDPADFLFEFDDSNTMYCSAIFLQRFCQIFWKIYPNVLFGMSVFQLPRAEDCPDYIAYRKKLVYWAALTWLAKEYLSKENYHLKTEEEVYNVLEKRGLLKARTSFLTGLYARMTGPDFDAFF